MSNNTSGRVLVRIPSLDSSILTDVRVACNVDENDTGFDIKLIPLINTQMAMAYEFGVGYRGFMITGTNETWRDWLGDNGADLISASTWLGYSVLMLFDPPDNSTLASSYKEQIQKMEWLLNERSRREGHVMEYVPDKASFYERLAEATVDED